MSVLLHGGVGGAIVEASAALTIVALAVGIWYRERRTRERE